MGGRSRILRRRQYEEMRTGREKIRNRFVTPPRKAALTQRLRFAVPAVLVAAVIAIHTLLFPNRPAAELKPMSIARLATPHSGLLLVAEAKGFFIEEGLKVDIRTSQSGYDAINQILAGKVDIGTAAQTPIARALAEGNRPKVIATIYASQWNTGIIARKDRGIASPADLQGKRIGFVFGSAAHYLMDVFLTFHRIPLASVSPVPLEGFAIDYREPAEASAI